MTKTEQRRQAIIADIRNSAADADVWTVFDAVQNANISHWRGTLGHWYILDGLTDYLRRREPDLRAAGVFENPDNGKNWAAFMAQF